MREVRERLLIVTNCLGILFCSVAIEIPARGRKRDRDHGDLIMPDQPIVWHYGLMAERWAETINDAPELPFFQQAIARFGQPVLDLACGTGRLLVPLLRAGIDIAGCDISGDMLHHCRRRAVSAGFNPHVYEQAMSAFDLPRRYKMIYICDSFGLAGSRENDLETLRRCYAHLEDKGALALNIQAEYASPESWNLWLREYRQALPQPWPQDGHPRIAADGSQHLARFRVVDIDPLEQSYTREVRLEKWVSGTLVASEAYTLRGHVYFKNELLLMLNIAGFREMTVRGDYTDEPATADHAELIFTAIR
jgi:SAM-dependent methyltransferase